MGDFTELSHYSDGAGVQLAIFVNELNEFVVNHRGRHDRFLKPPLKSSQQQLTLTGIEVVNTSYFPCIWG